MSTKRKRVNPRTVVKLLGGQHATARQFGVTQQAVYDWIRRWDESRKEIPPGRHIRLAKLLPAEYGYLVA